MPTVYEDSPAAALNRYVLRASHTSTSPDAITMPAIPAFGMYLAQVTGWFGNSGQRAYALYWVVYYKAATSSATLAAQQIGTTVVTPGQNITALALSAPDSTGVLTVTLTSTLGNSQGNAQVELIEMSALQDQYNV